MPSPASTPFFHTFRPNRFAQTPHHPANAIRRARDSHEYGAAHCPLHARNRRAAAEAGIAAGPKWSDIIDEAKFHYVVDRSPLREESEAWQRAQVDGMKIPEEMASWVASAGAPIDPKEDEGAKAEPQMETVKA